MKELFDVHCHMVPGVDDGAADLEESLAMLKKQHEDGVRKIIITPHYRRRRKGWAVNSHFGRLRMTYGIGYSDLFEPGFSFSTLNQWVHVAVVTNENGVDGEVRDGIPVMTKIYVNGQLMLSERGRDDRLPYTPNDKEVAMVAFTGLSATANRIGEKSTNGCMRHLHIWKSAKTQAEIQHLMDTPESVTGSESDLVCGWTLNKTVSDNNNIKDLTGKFSARLIGDFQWVENR